MLQVTFGPDCEENYMSIMRSEHRGMRMGARPALALLAVVMAGMSITACSDNSSSAADSGKAAPQGRHLT
jgi:hypothetical protein